MLGIMRKYQKSIVIKLMFWIIVLSFIGTIFLIWGKGEGGKAGGFAAKVNGSKISYEEFQQSYSRLRDLYRQLYGPAFTPELEKSLNLKKTAVDTLIDAALVRQEARRMGIKVGKDEIRAEIAKTPAFQKDGVFNFDRYQQLLKMNRITPAAFEESQEEIIQAKKTRKQIMDRVTVSDDEALQAFRKQNDRVELQFVSISPAELSAGTRLTPPELDDYLKKHADEFRTQEQVSIAYILVEPARVAGKVTISEEEAQTFYQKNIDRYQGKGEILPYAEVKDRVKADAFKQKAAKQAYETVADTLQKNLKGADLAAAAITLGAKVAETPLFTAKAPYAPLAGEAELLRKAFLLKEGELGGPVETSRGIYLLKLKERQPATVPPLEKIRPQVEAKAAQDKAKELARKKAEESLPLLAKADGSVKPQTTPAFAYSAGGEIPGIGKAPEIMEAAFALTTAAPVAKAPFKVGDRWYAIRLKNRVELNKEKFTQSKDQFKQSLLPKKQEEAVTKWLKELRDKAKITYNQALLAE